MEKKTLGQKLKSMGPAAIITSAFVGPGTITAATLAGVNFGYELLWAVLFSVISLIVLMEMASRIGIIGNKNFMEAAIDIIPGNNVWKYFVYILVGATVLSVAFGFEAGNIIGASLGLGDILGSNQLVAALIIGALALSTVLINSTKLLERIMLMFVSLMGLLFLITMIFVGPSIPEILKGLFIPTIPQDGIITTIALIGTTLIGINLILHSITSKEKWNKPVDLENARFDIVVNVLIGGIITIAIIITSATVLFNSDVVVDSPIVFSKQLEPVLGEWARIIGNTGIAAAGLSSAIAVPYTLGTIFSRLFNWEGGRESIQAKILGSAAVIFGTVLAIMNTAPIQIITAAQVTSGISLPFIAILLVIVTNNKKVLGKYSNNLFQNILGVIASIVTLGLGLWGLYGVFTRLFG